MKEEESRTAFQNYNLSLHMWKMHRAGGQWMVVSILTSQLHDYINIWNLFEGPTINSSAFSISGDHEYELAGLAMASYAAMQSFIQALCCFCHVKIEIYYKFSSPLLPGPQEHVIKVI